METNTATDELDVTDTDIVALRNTLGFDPTTFTPFGGGTESMMDLYATVEMVRQRQAELRAQAASTRAIHHDRAHKDSRRQRLGHTVITVGRWIQGHCPDLLPEAETANT